MGLGGYDVESCLECRTTSDKIWWVEAAKRSMCRECVLKREPDFFKHLEAHYDRVLKVCSQVGEALKYEGPDTPDGYDVDGFPGGDRRNNVYPTTRESALNALLDFVPEKDRSEIRGMIRDVLDVLDEHSDSDEEE